MRRKRLTAKQIIRFLREADVKLSQDMGITVQTYYRWRKKYGGMNTVQVKRLQGLERENCRLKKELAERTLDKLIMKEVLEGNH